MNVSILTMEKSEYQVISTLGDVDVGGNEFDVRLQAHFEKQFAVGGLEENLRAKWRLRAPCEKDKTELSTDQRAFIELDNFIDGHDLHGKITSATFKELCSDIITKTITITKECLRQANLTSANIDDVGFNKDE